MLLRRKAHRPKMMRHTALLSTDLLSRALLSLSLVCMTGIAPRLLATEDATRQEDIEARLQALEAKILQHQEALSTSTDEHAEVETRLKHNEKTISQIATQMNRLQTGLEQGEAQLVHLKGKQQELLTAKGEQQHYIAQQVAAAYEIGRAEYLMLLLSQEDPDEAARMLIYYEYFTRARAARVKAYQTTLDELAAVTQALAQEHQALGKQRQALNEQRRVLDASQVTRLLTLGTLNQQIRTTGSALSRLDRDRKRLEQILTQLRNNLTELAPPEATLEGTLEDTLAFSRMRGKLLLPVVGKIRHRFGSRRGGSRLKWQGLVLSAKEGQKVHAVHSGRVVFADWLRGFGWLIIIGHGEGYMSLYGHNQALHRDTGDWVTAGEVIAWAGKSGGQREPGVYFEIRQAGRPGDPLIWCVVRDRDAV